MFAECSGVELLLSEGIGIEARYPHLTTDVRSEVSLLQA
uniref:Uncharacterized protein n=1 Tax=Nelumbo nucifera TaxID=4432 RepID=A0A822XLZ6_NELNU|nr:TPA_asm: hypothetical protein HUJ06_021268 [Nelumbo nucifera]